MDAFPLSAPLPPVAALERVTLRASTLNGVLASIATVVIATLAVLMVLGEVGVSLGPLIAGAGIVGLALGFGAQRLVQDVLSGTFMLLEDQYGIGDTAGIEIPFPQRTVWVRPEEPHSTAEGTQWRPTSHHPELVGAGRGA